VAEKCLDDAELANTLRLNLPAKRTKSAVKRWTQIWPMPAAPAKRMPCWPRWSRRRL
jgi:hypothetical protein